jgi:ketosteroid isomerase-like protein
MDRLAIVERGYEAVAARDRETLLELFTEDAEWHLMNRAEVVRTFEGREAIVDFLLQFEDLRLEAITSVRDYLVVAAHSFTSSSGERVIATTLYQVPDRLVAVGWCSDVMR